MTIEIPKWLQGGTYSARLDRNAMNTLWFEGVYSHSDCAVTQRAAGANMSIDVSTGDAFIDGDDELNQGTYLVRITGAENVAVTAAPVTNSRYDRVCLRVNDPTAGGPAGNTATIVIVAGTPAASPVIPNIPATAISLAVIGPIPAGTTAITNALIDTRPNVTNNPPPPIGAANGGNPRLLAGRRATPGTMELYAGKTVPNGWLPCDGAAVLRASYPDLNAMMSANGYPYGAGNGSTTFNVPNLLDRVAVAWDGVAATLPTGGSANAVTVVHDHAAGTLTNATEAAHTHTSTAHAHDIAHAHTAGTSSTAGSHLHTVDSHAHGVAHTHSHSHTGTSHSHTASHDHGTITANNTAVTPSGNIYLAASSSNGTHDHSYTTNANSSVLRQSGPSTTSAPGTGSGTTGNAGAHTHTTTAILNMTTDTHNHTAAVGNATPTTSTDGSAATGTNAAASSINSTGTSAPGTDTVAGHTHTTSVVAATGNTGSTVAVLATAGAHTHVVTGNVQSTGSSATGANMQPYATIGLYIICT